MPKSNLYFYCRDQKEKATKRAKSDDITIHHNSLQAVNAWDELLGQTYKPNGLTKKRLEKTKATALKIIGYISNKEYKSKMIKRIKNLKI